MTALRHDAFQPTAQRLHWDPVRFRAISIDPIHAEPQPAPPQDLPEAGTWASQLARASIECLLGLRPTHQLTRWLAPPVHEALVSRTTANAHTPRPRGGHTVRVRQAIVSEVDDRTREVSCTVFDGSRFRACAMRMREHRGRWLVVALEIG